MKDEEGAKPSTDDVRRRSNVAVACLIVLCLLICQRQ